MFDLGEGEYLARVQTYELNRKSERLLIDVYEVLSDVSPYRFWAFPNLIFVRGRRRFFGKGQSEMQALNDCLARIREVPLSEIFPDLDETPRGPAEVHHLRA